MKQQHSIKNTAALVLALGALAEPAFAVTSIDICRDITQPGSYRLTRNLVATITGDCIVIGASHVTLDLAGHRIQGLGTEQGGGAVTVRTAGEGITVRNGAIAGFAIGVRLADKAVVERLNIFDTDQAILIGEGRVQGNTIAASGVAAIETFGRAIVIGNTIRESTFAGIQSNSLAPTDLPLANIQ
ncbi:MAG: hypothetical protein ACREXK_13985 [Gammaproteobacteria bacterium]